MSYFVIPNNSKIKTDAANEFVVFKINNHSPIFGILSLAHSKVLPPDLLPKTDEPKEIFLALGNSRFSKEKTKIPNNYKMVKRTNEMYSNDWVLSYYLNKYFFPQEIKELNKNGMELNDWINMYNNYWLTICDVKYLPINKKIKIIMLDRNVYDTKNTMKKGKLYTPSYFLKLNTATYWKTDSDTLEGKIKYKWQKEEEEPLDFSFHVEYKKNNWYPLTDGFLPEKDNQHIFTLLNKKKHWRDFPVSTHIGCRGPIILWSDLKFLHKKIYIL